MAQAQISQAQIQASAVQLTLTEQLLASSPQPVPAHARGKKRSRKPVESSTQRPALEVVEAAPVALTVSPSSATDVAGKLRFLSQFYPVRDVVAAQPTDPVLKQSIHQDVSPSSAQSSPQVSAQASARAFDLITSTARSTTRSEALLARHRAQRVMKGKYRPATTSATPTDVAVAALRQSPVVQRLARDLTIGLLILLPLLM